METKNIGSFTSQGHFGSPYVERVQTLTVGCPKETQVLEKRVGLTPTAAREILSNNHKVVIQSGAGVSSGFNDEEYKRLGCEIVDSVEEVYKRSQLVMKVLAPTLDETQMVQPNQVIMGFWSIYQSELNHLEEESKQFKEQKQIIEIFQKKKTIFIDYNSIENASGTRPVVQPMSEILGQMAVQQGMKFLERQMGGSGVMLGSVTGVSPARVTILGSGIAGQQAARVASSTGARVTLMDVDLESLRQARQNISGNIYFTHLNLSSLEHELSRTDVLIGAVFPQYYVRPRFIVTKKQIRMMKTGSVVIDLAMWYGGNFESSRPTTMEKPTFVYENVVHFCATDMWSSVPRFASEALSTSVLPFALQVSNRGWQNASIENVSLMNGIISVDGEITNQMFSTYYKMTSKPIEQILKPEIEKRSTHTQDMITLKMQLGQFQRQTNRTNFTIEA